uniref:Uncharacterized protein n=1 Tax=Arundo donax TaxID=35708 RepID=A0A0A8ZMT5_ARUDO
MYAEKGNLQRERHLMTFCQIKYTAHHHHLDNVVLIP